MPGLRDGVAARYGVSAGATGLALGLNLLVKPWIESNTFPPFFAAVMVATWFGGLGPGLAATLLSGAATAYFFLPPAFSLAVAGPGPVVRLVLFLLSSLLIAGLGAALRSAQSRAERTALAVGASEEKLRALLEAAPDGIVIVDRRGRIVLANGEAQKMFGYTVEELIGQPVEILVPERLRDRHQAHRAAYLAAPRTRPKGQVTGLVGRRKDGGEFPAEISLSPVETAEGLLVVSDIRDVTERRRVDDHITALNEDLARRVTELAAVNKELEAFSYSVSHDLRAPLRSIDGFSQALLEDYGDQLDPRGRDYLRRVRTATQRMDHLIDDLLTLSRVTRHEMHREPVDLSAQARAIVAGLRRAEPARRVEVAIADGLVALGDPHLLRVVLENLIGNAWKFTSPRPTARIEFGQTAHDGARVFFVRDNGVGFDMKYADKLFGAFQRLHGVAEFPGTGVGLATVQRIINRHGGQVWAEAAIDQGATFYFGV